MKNNIKAFELDKLYQKHKDYVYELVSQNLIYSEEYLNVLFKQYEGTLFSSREDLLRIVHGNYFDEELLINRPLAKLASDIQLQF
ncbi:MAG: hypothetical protein KDD13_11175, partial [Mangrovimonas sp.]|nr:hypothetical protein [Mangrovimonas sp.]